MAKRTIEISEMRGDSREAGRLTDMAERFAISPPDVKLFS